MATCPFRSDIRKKSISRARSSWVVASTDRMCELWLQATLPATARLRSPRGGEVRFLELHLAVRREKRLYVWPSNNAGNSAARIQRLNQNSEVEGGLGVMEKRLLTALIAGLI